MILTPLAAKNSASLNPDQTSPIKAHDPYPQMFFMEALSKECSPDARVFNPLRARTEIPIVVKNPTMIASLLNVLAQSLWSERSGSQPFIFYSDDPIKSSRRYLMSWGIKQIIMISCIVHISLHHHIIFIIKLTKYKMSIKKYLDDHGKEQFWREILNSTEQTLVAKNQIIKIESNKLRVERIKLILDNIEDILEGEVKRLDIKNQMTEIKKQKVENLMKELEEIKAEKNKNVGSYKFLIDKDKSILQVFDLPELMEGLEEDKEEHGRVMGIVKERFKDYPILRQLIAKEEQTKKIKQGDDYLLHEKYIEGKELDQGDMFLLQSQYWPLVTKKLEEKELGRLLQGLWSNGELKENILGRKIQKLQKKFRQQTHF